MCVGTGIQKIINSVLQITVLFLGKHKWEPEIYVGFSLALHLQCSVKKSTGIPERESQRSEILVFPTKLTLVNSLSGFYFYFYLTGLVFNFFQLVFLLELKTDTGQVSHILSDISRALYSLLLYTIGRADAEGLQ